MAVCYLPKGANLEKELDDIATVAEVTGEKAQLFLPDKEIFAAACQKLGYLKNTYPKFDWTADEGDFSITAVIKKKKKGTFKGFGKPKN